MPLSGPAWRCSVSTTAAPAAGARESTHLRASADKSWLRRPMHCITKTLSTCRWALYSRAAGLLCRDPCFAHTLLSGRRHWRAACRTACQPRAGGRCAPAARCCGLLAQYTRGFFCNRDHSPRPHARAKQPASAASLGLACSHARNPAAFQLLWTCTDQPPHAHRAPSQTCWIPSNGGRIRSSGPAVLNQKADANLGGAFPAIPALWGRVGVLTRPHMRSAAVFCGGH